MGLSRPLQWLRDEHSDPFLGGAVVSAPTVVGDDGGDWDFGQKPRGSCSGREQLRMVISNIEGLFSRAGLLGPDNGLGVLPLAERGLPNRLT